MSQRKKSTAPVPPVKSDSTLSRMQRSYDRDESRMGSGKTASRHKFVEIARQARSQWRSSSQSSATVETGYGPVNLSKFPTRDRAPKVTTVKGNYQNSSVGHKYSDLTGVLVPPTLTGKKRTMREREVANELLHTIEHGEPPKKKRHIEEGEQSNAAAKLLAISHISEPERVSGVDKKFRGDLRRVSKGLTTFDDVFGGNDPEFGMAKTPNITRKRMGKGRYKKAHGHSSYQDHDGNISDSSDEE